MTATKACRFVMVGSGRVASHLAPALVRGGAECLGLFSRTTAHATPLATKLGTEVIYDLPLFIASQSDRIDLILLSVSDDAIGELAPLLTKARNALIAHTSGSTPMSVLSASQKYGVLYPMQTFSHKRAIDLSKVPFFIEASDEQSLTLLEHIAAKVIGAHTVTVLSSEERARLHLAAVFACNFANHLWAIADEILAQSGLSFPLLRPLVTETIDKAFALAPKEVQTGPALRDDQKTMARHLHLLTAHPQWAELYSTLSQSINDLGEKKASQVIYEQDS